MLIGKDRRSHHPCVPKHSPRVLTLLTSIELVPLAALSQVSFALQLFTALCEILTGSDMQRCSRYAQLALPFILESQQQYSTLQ